MNTSVSTGVNVEGDSDFVPVIAIDGPSASGKGTVASLVARQLGFHYLDSGALYRLTALAAERQGVSWHEEMALAALAERLSVRFEANAVWLDGEPVDDVLRSENTGAGASSVAQYPAVRAALLARQRAFRRAPGLVADGRDMASVVFPDASLKIFLTASPEIRAERRYKQLMEKGMDVKIDNLLLELTRQMEERDARDAARAVAPLVREPNAELLDTSAMTIQMVVDWVLARWKHLQQM
jgi:cytidylate kinase